MEKARPKTTRDAKQKQNVQQFNAAQEIQDTQQFNDVQQIQDSQPVDMQQGFYDAAEMPGILNSPLMPICAVMPMPFDPFCPQFSPEEALRKGTLFKWLYSPYTPCAPKPRRKCTC